MLLLNQITSAATVAANTVATSNMVPNPETDLGGFLSALVSAFQAGDYVLLGGMTVMIVVWMLSRYGAINTPWLPMCSAVLGCLGGILTSYINGVGWGDALQQGLLTGGQATLLWSLVGKRLFSKTKTI